MFRKILFILVTVANFVAIFNVQFYSDLIPFYILLGIYILSSIVIILANQLAPIDKTLLTGLMEKMILNGKTVVFLTFLSVLDLILFMLLVPDSSLQYLQTELQSSFLFYGLLIFFIPVSLSKFLLEPKGKQIEEVFWLEYRKNIFTTKPSTDFALFILARIQMKLHPLNRVQQQIEAKEDSRPMEEEIYTTTFPMDYSQRIDPETLENKTKNTLFDSNDDLAEDNMFEKYFDEIFQTVPVVEEMTKLKPLNMKPELFLQIIIERTIKDEQIMQYFKSLT